MKLTRRSVVLSAFLGAPGMRLTKAVPHVDTLEIGGATVEIFIGPGLCDLSTQELVQWVATAARAVTSYFGKFPVAHARVELELIEGKHGVLRGSSFGEQGALSKMALGQHSTVADLQNDWTMTHEMVHFGFPSVRRRHHWIEEGSATYIEPIARAQIGNLTPQRVWGDMVRDMRQGLPQPDEQGLDMTHTWAATYWGGALFCLLADVRIRERTRKQKGLEDAFRAINHAGGTIEVDWPLERALEIGAQATDSRTLPELYQQMGLHRMDVDLTALWQGLGVLGSPGSIRFDPKAPLAATRTAICA